MLVSADTVLVAGVGAWWREGRDRGVAFLLAEVGGLLLRDKWLVCCLDRDWHTEDVVIEVCNMELDRSAYPSALREGGEAM